jgi:hypothetical protein
MSFSTKLASLYHVDQCRLELKSSISTVTVGPVRMLLRVSAEYSRRDLFAITSNVGVKLRTVESKDHVWFEDRWMVASWCDE